ncbi:MAG TPA: retention module-containing protein, partial [Gammaproteobacteria bacterium]|nr:retention module-containing protein [Gammaproteobacteria bacterium]
MASAHIGRVETIDGGVTVTPLSGIESPLTQGMPVYMNDLIKTDADASVRLRLHDGSSLLIGGGQTISLDENFVDVSGTGILISESSISAVTVTGITTVSSVEGKVQVVRGGIPHDLVAGDLLYPGDTLIAAADGSAILQLSDGSETVIEPGSQSRLGGSNIAQQEGEFLTSGIDDPAEIQAAILAGRDPSQDAPAPGVGETESNEGHTHVRILPSGRAVTPDSGHETHGQDLPVSFYTEELLQKENSIPVIVVDPGNPGGANDQVFEAALSPNGSNPTSNGEFAYGQFTLSDADGLDDLVSVTINGTTVLLADLAGTSFSGSNGTLTVTAYDVVTGVADYKYELTTPATDVAGIESDDFTLTVSDGTVDSLPASIVIEITDDVPQAINDTGSIAEDAVTPVTGGVLGNDITGADVPAAFVAWTDTAASYGTFTDTGGGTYSYALNNSDPRVQGLDQGQSLTETFTYTMKDADGDPRVATLTISINGSNDVPVIVVDPGNPGGANDQVFEAALSPNGSNPTSNGEFAYGQFTLS